MRRLSSNWLVTGVCGGASSSWSCPAAFSAKRFNTSEPPPSSADVAKARKVLGTQPGSSIDDVKKAYKAMAKAHHPDLNGGKTNDRMGEINEAWQTLQAHEKHGGDSSRGGSGGGNPFQSSSSPGGGGFYYTHSSGAPEAEYYWSQQGGMPFGAGDMGGPFGGFDNPFDEAFAQGRGRRPPPGGSGRYNPYEGPYDHPYGGGDPFGDEYVQYGFSGYPDDGMPPPGGMSFEEDPEVFAAFMRGEFHPGGEFVFEDEDGNVYGAEGFGMPGYSPRGHDGRRAHPNQRKKPSKKKKPQGDGTGTSSSSSSGAASSQQPNEKLPWSDADNAALKNMYEEGKSFDFIANALGRAKGDVTAQYNTLAHEGTGRPRVRKFGGGSGTQKKKKGGNFDSKHVDVEDRFYDGDVYNASGEPVDFDVFELNDQGEPIKRRNPHHHDFAEDDDGTVHVVYEDEESPFPFSGKPYHHQGGGGRGGGGGHRARGRGGRGGRGRGGNNNRQHQGRGNRGRGNGKRNQNHRHR